VNLNRVPPLEGRGSARPRRVVVILAPTHYAVVRLIYLRAVFFIFGGSLRCIQSIPPCVVSGVYIICFIKGVC